MKSERNPETDSIEELARFWDSHDLTDFETNSRRFVFQGEPGVKLSIRLNRPDLQHRNERPGRRPRPRNLPDVPMIRTCRSRWDPREPALDLSPGYQRPSG